MHAGWASVVKKKVRCVKLYTASSRTEENDVWFYEWIAAYLDWSFLMLVTLLMCSTMSLVVFFSFLFFPFFFNPKTYSVPRGTPKFSLFKVCKRHVAPVWIWLSDWCVSVELKNFWKQAATFPAAAWRMSTCHCDHCVQSPLNWIVHWIGYLFMVYHCTCTELITTLTLDTKEAEETVGRNLNKRLFGLMFWSPATIFVKLFSVSSDSQSW